MTDFTYTGFGHPIPEEILASQQAAWQQLAGPGSWWTGAQRVAIAREVRAARAVRNDPPWQRAAWPEVSDLPEAAVEVARKVAIDAQRLDRAWCEKQVEALGDGAYVEAVAVSVFTTILDAFADALGSARIPLPAPRSGEPDRVRPDGLGDAGAWVAMTVPFSGPNVGRALSLVPADLMAFMGMVGSMYALADFTELVWDRPLKRPQVELVAARVSAVNECFY